MDKLPDPVMRQFLKDVEAAVKQKSLSKIEIALRQHLKDITNETVADQNAILKDCIEKIRKITDKKRIIYITYTGLNRGSKSLRRMGRIIWGYILKSPPNLDTDTLNSFRIILFGNPTPDIQVVQAAAITGQTPKARETIIEIAKNVEAGDERIVIETAEEVVTDDREIVEGLVVGEVTAEREISPDLIKDADDILKLKNNVKFSIIIDIAEGLKASNYAQIEDSFPKSMQSKLKNLTRDEQDHVLRDFAMTVRESFATRKIAVAAIRFAKTTPFVKTVGFAIYGPNILGGYPEVDVKTLREILNIPDVSLASNPVTKSTFVTGITTIASSTTDGPSQESVKTAESTPSIVEDTPIPKPASIPIQSAITTQKAETPEENKNLSLLARIMQRIKDFLTVLTFGKFSSSPTTNTKVRPGDVKIISKPPELTKPGIPLSDTQQSNNKKKRIGARVIEDLRNFFTPKKDQDFEAQKPPETSEPEHKKGNVPKDSQGH